MHQRIRIGNAQAFWGDRQDAAAQMLAREPGLDFLTLDYLAEVSMSILAMQRERDAAAGFARDFVDVVRSLVPYWSAGGRCRLVTNAGGLNPRACAQACKEVLDEAPCLSLCIGIVSGDDVLDAVRAAAADPSSNQFCNLDSGAAIGEVHQRLVTANAYLGAAPIARALAQGADIVITGRVADPSLVVAPCMHHFGWTANDLDRLAGATVAGHLIECGTQVTGGISTDWLEVPDVAELGFPFVEVAPDGSCVVTKPRGTGGCVTELTVKEQLVYEIGDPANYLSPDVTVSFLPLHVDDLGGDRVRVSGARGRPASKDYKVSATYRDGFRSAGTLTIVGRQAVRKARRCGEIVLDRVRQAGFTPRDSVIECLGSGDGAAAAGLPAISPDACTETVLRIAVETESHDVALYFSRELAPLITSGPQGTTGYAEGRPRVHPVFRYWPCLIDCGGVTPRVEMLPCGNDPGIPAARSDETSNHASPPVPLPTPRETGPSHRGGPRVPPPSGVKTLYDLACARSGDKGASANIGVIARSADAWEFLRTWLTAERVAAFFSRLDIDSVERFELPNLHALNFVLHGALRRSLRTDAQGKALGQVLLQMPVSADDMRTMH
jgi:hypothetical protein